MTIWNLYDLGLKCNLPDSFYPSYNLPEDLPKEILSFLTGSSSEFPPPGNQAAYSPEGHSINIVTTPTLYAKGIEGLIDFLGKHKGFQMVVEKRLNLFWRDEPMFAVHATTKPDLNMPIDIEIQAQAYSFHYQGNDLVLMYTKSIETKDVEGLPLSILDSLEPLNFKLPMPEKWVEKEIDLGIKMSVPKTWGSTQPNIIHKGVTGWNNEPPMVVHLFSIENKRDQTLDDLLQTQSARGVEKIAVRTKINDIPGIFKNIIFYSDYANRSAAEMRFTSFKFIHKNSIVTLKAGGPSAIWKAIENVVDRIIQSVKLEEI
jgi:hypothetical protein